MTNGIGSSTRAPMLALRFDRRLRPDRPELAQREDWRFAGFDDARRSRTRAESPRTSERSTGREGLGGNRRRGFFARSSSVRTSLRNQPI